MARVVKALPNLNDAIELDIPEDESGYGSVHYKTGGAGTVVVEAQLIDGDWQPLGLTSSTGAVVANLAAAGIATFLVAGYNKIRARKSVAGAGEIGLAYGRN